MSPSGSVLVVGAGVFGLSAAIELRRRGRDVTLLDPGPLPHPRASSTDVSKIVRMDYGTDDFLTELAALALAGWRAWNAAVRPPPFHRDGFLVLAGDTMAPGGFEYESFRRLTERGVPLERLDALRIGVRYPAWNAERFPDGYYNPEAGWAESSRIVARLARRAELAGVRIRPGTAAGLVERAGRVRGVRLVDGGTVEATLTVAAAGAWTPSLVPGLDGLLRPVGQPVVHLGVDDPARWSGPTFPVWAADIARTGWYGFPATPGGHLKIGHHGEGLPGVDPRQDVPFPEGHVERCRAFLRGALPGLADAPVVERRVCFYCDAFDGRFLVDRHPRLEGLVVAAGGSGHGFKFAPVLGPVIADAAEGRESAWGGPFRWREPARAGRVTEDARYAGESGE